MVVEVAVAWNQPQPPLPPGVTPLQDVGAGAPTTLLMFHATGLQTHPTVTFCVPLVEHVLEGVCAEIKNGTKNKMIETWRNNLHDFIRVLFFVIDCFMFKATP